MRHILRWNSVRSLDDRNQELSEVLLHATKTLRCRIYQRLSGGGLDAVRVWISSEKDGFNWRWASETGLCGSDTVVD